MWPPAPLTRSERWLRVLALALLGVWLAAWALPSMFRLDCHSMAACGAEPTTSNYIGLAAFGLSVVVAIVLLAHHRLVKRRSAQVQAAASTR